MQKVSGLNLQNATCVSYVVMESWRCDDAFRFNHDVLRADVQYIQHVTQEIWRETSY